MDNFIERSITRTRRKLSLIRIVTAILIPLFLLIGCFILIDSIFILPSWARILWFACTFLLPLVLLIMILSSLPNNSEIASWVEKKYPEFRGRLITSIEIHEKTLSLLGYSENFMHRIRDSTSKILKTISLSCIIKERIKPIVFPLIFSLLLTTIPIAFLSSISLFSLKRLLLPLKPNFSLAINTKEEVPYGGMTEVRAIPSGVSPRKIYINTKDSQIAVYKKGGWKTTIKNIREDMTCYARLSDVCTETKQIRVIVSPYIRKLAFIYSYPEYTKIPESIRDASDIYTLVGTKIGIKGKANTELKSVTLKFKNSKEIEGDIDGKNFTTSFTVTGNDTLYLELTSVNGLKNKEENFYEIKAFPDEFPEISVLSPSRDMPLPRDMVVDLVYEVKDDYGIDRARLYWSKNGEKKSMNLINFGSGVTDTIVETFWNTEKLSLLPGDSILYFIEVRDNDTYRGPKRSRSRTYKLYFPSIEEIYKQVADETGEMEGGLKEVMHKLKKIEQGLSEITNKGKTGLSYEEKETVKKLLKEQKKLRKDIENLSSKFDKMPENNLLLNQDIAQKLQKIRELMKDIETEEMKKAMEDLENALKENPDKLREALKNFKLSEEELKRRLDKTLEVLKNIKKSQEIQRLAQEAERLTKLQDRINKEMREGKNLKKLAGKEMTLKHDLASLKRDMEKLEEPSLEKEIKNIPLIEGKMAMAASNLSTGKSPQSTGEEIKKSLSSLASTLKSLLKKRASKELVRELKRMEKELTFLSMQEEALLSNQDPETQQSIIDGSKLLFSRMEAFFERAPFLSPDAKSFLQDAIVKMDKAKDKIINRKSARKSILSAMRDLNIATMELMSQERGGAPSAGGIAQLFKQLAQLAKQQMGLNQLAQALFPISLSGKNIQKELESLIAKQKALAKKLSSLSQSLSGRVPGDLRSMASEMEKLAEEMRKNGLTKDILNRQQRLLRHLLDSQKSIYTKKKSRKRISEPGKNFTNLKSPGRLNLRTERGITRKDVLRALRGNYPTQYERLIREYFRALSTE